MADAWYLPFDGVDDVITTGSIVGGSFDDRVNTSADWTLDIDWSLDDSGLHRFFDRADGADAALIRASDGLVRFNLRVSQVQWSLGSGVIPVATRFTLRLQKVPSPNVYRLFIDGVQVGGDIASPAVTQFNWDVFGKDGSTGDRFDGNLYQIIYTANAFAGVNLHLKNSVNATQTIFEDIVGTNDATLSGFASPPPWVLYDDGTGGAGVTADVTEASPSFADSIEATLTKELSASIIELAPSFADAIESTLTGNTEASITGLAPSFADLINATLTGAANTVQITELLPAFASAINATLTGNQSATVTETAPSFSASITATTFPAGVTAASIIESAPSFTASINVTIIGNTTAQINGLAPSFSDVVNASLSVRIEPRINELAPSFSASLTATVPSKWIDVVVPSATWTDKTTTSATWINIR